MMRIPQVIACNLLGHVDDRKSTTHPLLRAYYTPSLGRRRKLSDINGDLGGADADGETVDEATDDEHTDVLGSTRDDGTYDPDGTANLDSTAATKLICEIARNEST